MFSSKITVSYSMEAVLFIGIPATGKSRFFKEHFVDTHVRINLDMLKTRYRENCLFNACLEGKAKFVIDNTNVTREERQRYILPAKETGFEVTGYFFQSCLDQALQQNALRSEMSRIPNLGVRSMSKKLEIPDWSEGFDRLFFVRHEGSSQIIENWRV